jgi:molybdate transport system substrate-binding protein
VELLTDPRVTRIAIADQTHAPYGRAAAAYLRANHLDERLKPKLVTAENIAQTAQFVESGNAQIGFVSLTFASSAHGKEVGSFARLAEQYPKIVQCGVVLKNSQNLAEAQKFFSWVLGPEVQGHLQEFGLQNVR